MIKLITIFITGVLSATKVVKTNSTAQAKPNLITSIPLILNPSNYQPPPSSFGLAAVLGCMVAVSFLLGGLVLLISWLRDRDLNKI